MGWTVLRRALYNMSSPAHIIQRYYEQNIQRAINASNYLDLSFFQNDITLLLIIKQLVKVELLF